MKLHEILREIRTFNPVLVSFEIYPRSCVICEVRLSDKGENVARGVAICSVRDKFNVKKGKLRAAGRALKALKNSRCSEPIRDSFDKFPGGWTLRQAKRVLYYSSVCFKSLYIRDFKLVT